MPDFLGYMCNCPIGGEDFSEVAPRRRVRNRIELRLNGYDCTLLQDPTLIPLRRQETEGDWVHTTNVLVRSVSEAEIPRVRLLLRDLADLLAFATHSRVWHMGFEFPAGSGQETMEASTGVTSCSLPVFDVRNGTILRTYVSSVWGAYKHEKTRRQLPIIFDYLVQAEQGSQVLELKLVIMFLVLESLKDTYAKVAGIPFHRGYFRKVSAPPKRRLSAEPRISFEELLTGMLRDVGMRRGVKRIVKLRNELFHSAIARRPFNIKWRYYLRCHDIISEYLLRLLGYSGAFISYEKRRPIRLQSGTRP